MKRVTFAILFLLFGLLQEASAESSGPILNPAREYPPSCLAWPLPLPAGSEPYWTVQATVPTVDNTYTVVGNETVTYIFWRSPCNGGKAALLGQMQRDSSKDNLSPAPVFGHISATQQGLAQPVWLRTALEPNTIVAGIDLGVTAVYSYATFVLEEGYSTDTSYLLDYTHALTVTINGLQPASLAIPAYNPAQYAGVGQPMQISGYQTGNYGDAAGAQGVQVEVAESLNPGKRYIVLAWYTYDPSNIAYWLFNSTEFDVGDRQVTFPIGYFHGGGFAGSAGGQGSVWGNVTVSFPDCNHMVMTYDDASGLPSGVPTGNGTRTFTRVTAINGATCDL